MLQVHFISNTSILCAYHFTPDNPVILYKRMTAERGLIEFWQGDMERFNDEIGKYDLVTAFGTSCFGRGYRERFREAAKILKSGGLFLVVNELDSAAESDIRSKRRIAGASWCPADYLVAAMEGAQFSDAKSYVNEWGTMIAQIAWK